MKFKISVSLIFIGIFILRIVRPELNIDSISIILIVLALIPWFIQHIKTLEINGVGKVELLTKDQKLVIQKTADEAGISSTNKINSAYTFYNLRYEDPKLALAGLRIELEAELTKLIEKENLNIRQIGLPNMTRTLVGNGIITNSERDLIFDITKILNKAVHNQLGEYNSETFDWVFNIGLNLLDSLQKKSGK